ncbi:microfibril-associated glycoprotein 4-like [Denticeps clupeoides]|uniref:microfibril-associated glycoprotein 4-like n=1 Tax=Denticeps clupeoides TaxID=299321 RepID=UPI0010A3B74C|nr:microfibril-associated glycoprotein 4-like [Denticeps clupeoides]
MMVFCFLALVFPLLVSSLPTLPQDCEDLYSSGHTLSEVYTIYPAGISSPVQAYCDMGCEDSEKNEHWTVIQRRFDGSVNFYRPWDQYRNGFGFKDGEYWLGLEWLHQLTKKKKYELRVDLEDFEKNKAHALYSTFSVGSEDEGYTLTVSGFVDGGAGDSLTYHSGQKFSTFDKDQDSDSGNCATRYLGAFWYNSCHFTNPNGIYKWGREGTLYATGVDWRHWKGYDYSLKLFSMKIRPVT